MSKTLVIRSPGNDKALPEPGSEKQQGLPWDRLRGMARSSPSRSNNVDNMCRKYRPQLPLPGQLQLPLLPPEITYEDY